MVIIKAAIPIVFFAVSFSSIAMMCPDEAVITQHVNTKGRGILVDPEIGPMVFPAIEFHYRPKGVPLKFRSAEIDRGSLSCRYGNDTSSIIAQPDSTVRRQGNGWVPKSNNWTGSIIDFRCGPPNGSRVTCTFCRSEFLNGICL